MSRLFVRLPERLVKPVSNVLTLYSFSSENWSRPLAEVEELFRLLRFFIRTDLAELHKNNTIIRVIGERDQVPNDVLNLLDEALSLTKDNTGLTLVIAFNYGARNEITNAVKRIASKVAAGEIDVEAIDHDLISHCLDTQSLPDPDLIIRTSRRTTVEQLSSLASCLFRVFISAVQLARIYGR